MEYTEDVFQEVSEDILWRWGYNQQSGRTPRDITPYCLECIPPRPLRYEVTPPNKVANFFLVRIERSIHPLASFKTFDNTSSGKPFDVIKKRIEKKLEDGSWVEAVNNRRMALKVPPHSPDIAGARKLDEIKMQVLKAIGQCGGDCLIDKVVEWFEISGAPINRVKLDRHLHDLEKQGYIQLHRSAINPYLSCSLTQKGRVFLDDNHLLD